MKTFRELTRPLRRLFKPFLSREELDAVAAAVAQAEAATTGEIRVHLTGTLSGEPLAAAREAFGRLGLAGTAQRNAVLILIGDLDHRFAIWGDEGIHAKAGQPLWEEASRILAEGLKAGRRGDAVVACVRAVGRELARHFPRAPGSSDVNELPDDVTRD